MDSAYSPIWHVYQRALDKGVIFYTVEDRLVYYTLAAVKAKRHHIRVYAGSIMFTHAHHSVEAASWDPVANYLRDTGSSFVRLYNKRHSRKGQFLERHPGHDPKYSSKDKKSNLIYVFNNHVEKKLCKRALDERWSLLAYAFSDHPFSAEIDFQRASRVLLKAVRLVNRRVRKLQGLEYRDLDKILPNLKEEEREQFIDYVISRYAWIDFSGLVKMFGSLESSIIAIDSTTGGEYNVKEDFTHFPDMPYLELINLAESRNLLTRIFSMNPSEKANIILWARRYTSANNLHLSKFFHEEFSIK